MKGKGEGGSEGEEGATTEIMSLAGEMDEAGRQGRVWLQYA